MQSVTDTDGGETSTDKAKTLKIVCILVQKYSANKENFETRNVRLRGLGGRGGVDSDETELSKCHGNCVRSQNKKF